VSFFFRDIANVSIDFSFQRPPSPPSGFFFDPTDLLLNHAQYWYSTVNYTSIITPNILLSLFSSDTGLHPYTSSSFHNSALNLCKYKSGPPLYQFCRGPPPLCLFCHSPFITILVPKSSFFFALHDKMRAPKREFSGPLTDLNLPVSFVSFGPKSSFPFLCGEKLTSYRATPPCVPFQVTSLFFPRLFPSPQHPQLILHSELYI